MQDIYKYTPKTNHIPKVYSVEAILLLQYMAHVMLFPIINPLHCISVLPAVCAVLSVAVLFSSGTSRFPSTLLRYFLSDFQMVPVAPCYYRYHFILTFHLFCIYNLRSS